MDERYWLLTSSYNTGIECLQYGLCFPSFTRLLHMTTLPSVCLLDDARRWFEASSRICGHVPDGVVRAKRVGHTLLSS